MAGKRHTHFVAESHIGDLYTRGQVVAAADFPEGLDTERLIRLGALRPETPNEREARLSGTSEAASPRRHGDTGKVTERTVETGSEGAGAGGGEPMDDDPRLRDASGKPLEGAARAAALRKMADEQAAK